MLRVTRYVKSHKVCKELQGMLRVTRYVESYKICKELQGILASN